MRCEVQIARFWLLRIPKPLRTGVENDYPSEKFGYDVSVRPSVRILPIKESRNESLSSPVESFVRYCFKRL